jgi:uncharacterized damage-inducible protein DinB
MLETLRDLYAHQAWADAVHWHAISSHPGALDDQTIRERLRHIHTVQAAFLALARGEAPSYADLEGDPSIDEVRRGAIAFHEGAAAWLNAASPERLAALIDIPWFQDPPCRIPIGAALLQAVSHSQYHRGQNATRLRELGKKPPTTDLIVWYWKGRPGPRWS